MTLETVSEGYVDVLGHKTTDSDLLIYQIDSNNESTTQVSAI